MCQTSLENIGPCDSLINLEVIIKAIFNIPLRMRLISSFSTCTYIPFLIRWDLVPPWKPSDKDNQNNSGEKADGDGGNNGDSNKGGSDNDNEPNCADNYIPPEEKPYSAFEQELLDLDKNNINLIDAIRNDPSNDVKPSNEAIEIPERGVPVKRTKDDIKEVDINADFRMGKRIAEADTNTDVISTKENVQAYSQDMIYHILTYGKDASKQKEKDFPFHTKRILVND